jgi:hypothetical protein
MDKALLVTFDLETGRRIVHALDTAQVKVNVALWAALSEYSDWRLILSSRRFDELGLAEAYDLVIASLNKAGFSVEERDPIMILRMKDKFICDLRRTYARSKGIANTRVTGSFGDRYIEDGYIYRIT